MKVSFRAKKSANCFLVAGCRRMDFAQPCPAPKTVAGVSIDFNKLKKDTRSKYARKSQISRIRDRAGMELEEHRWIEQHTVAVRESSSASQSNKRRKRDASRE